MPSLVLRRPLHLNARSLEIRAEMPVHSNVWEVELEKIVQHRSYDRNDQWLVKWKGYTESHNNWEPWENLLLEIAV